MFGGISAPDDTVAAIVGVQRRRDPGLRPVRQGQAAAGLSEHRQDLRIRLHGEDQRHPVRLHGRPDPRRGCTSTTWTRRSPSTAAWRTTRTSATAPGSWSPSCRPRRRRAPSSHGVGNYVAVSFGGTGGFQIFDMSDPLHPVSKLIGLRSQPAQGSRCGTRARRTTSAPAGRDAHQPAADDGDL